MIGVEQDGVDRSTLRDEGLAWVDLITSGEATHADAAALKAWRAQSPAHARALADADRLRRTIEQVARADRVAPPRRAAERSAAVSRRALLGGAIAASVAGLALVRPPAGLWPSLAELTGDARTAPGERRQLALADDVHAELNTRTSISALSDAGGSGVALIAGEAFLQGKAGARAAYFVDARGGRASAAGAASFAVRDDDGRVCVTCLSGRVTVTLDGASAALLPRQQLIYAAGVIEPVRPVDAEQVLAWRRGFIVFRDVPLSRVVAEVNRYRGAPIMLTNARLADRPVFATFRTDQTDTVVEQIRTLAGADVTRLPGGVVVLS